MAEFVKASTRVNLSPGGSVRVAREILGWSQNELAKKTEGRQILGQTTELNYEICINIKSTFSKLIVTSGKQSFYRMYESISKS